MATIKLKVSEKILDKVLWLLGQFSPEEVEVIESDAVFKANKSELNEELEKLKSGEGKTYSLEEVDAILEETIRKYEIEHDPTRHTEV